MRRGAGEGRRRHLRATAETSLGPALAHLNKHSQEARRGRDTAAHKGKQARVLMLASQLRTLPDGRTGGATTDRNKEHGRIFTGRRGKPRRYRICDELRYGGSVPERTQRCGNPLGPYARTPTTATPHTTTAATTNANLETWAQHKIPHLIQHI